MTSTSKNVCTLILILGLLSGCQPGPNAVVPPTVEKTVSTPPASTATAEPSVFATQTQSIRQSPTSTPMPTPSSSPIVPEQATLEAFGPVCSDGHIGEEISPDGKWIIDTCYNENNTESSPLQVVSLDHSRKWKINLLDYATVGVVDRHDAVIPYRWSKDGRFLYAIVGSRLEGCCWIGHRTILLVRLNLETGEQIELLNATNLSVSFPFDFQISNSDRYLLFTPPTNQPYDFAILDLQTWKTQIISLKFLENIDLIYALFSPSEDKIILPLFKNLKFNDFQVSSIALIDLKTSEQKLLISGLEQGNELFPIRWVDDVQVLLSNTNPNAPDNQLSTEFWLLNIYSGQLTKTQKP